MKEVGYDGLLTAYKAESSGLVAMGAATVWRVIDEGFGHYGKFLGQRRKTGKSKRLGELIRRRGGVLDAGLPDTEVRNALYLAHFAVCCGLFDGWELLGSQIATGFLDGKIESELKGFEAASSEQLIKFINRLHVSDAARTIHILRLLGLCLWNSKQIRQLSLACGPGSRDIEGLHQVPIPMLVEIKNPLGGLASKVRLARKIERPKNLVLVDNDADIGQWFSDMNRKHKDWLYAFNDDAAVVFSGLQEFLKGRGWGMRNAVVGLRIDHRMIPSIEEFFSGLSDSLDKAVDLIITIGAGHSLDEFAGRVKVITDLFAYLRDRDMTPVIIKLHGSGSLEEQRHSPYFGFSPLTTYEILYCKVYRDRLV